MKLRCMLLPFMICCLMFLPYAQADDITYEYDLTVTLNRPSYEPGFIVFISGQLTYADGTAAPNEFIGVQILKPISPNNTTEDFFQSVTDTDGMYSVMYPLNTSASLGTYSVVIAKGYARANSTFDVVEDAPNLPPYAPTDPSPSNGTSGVAISLLLSWIGDDPDPDDSVTYTVFFGDSISPLAVSENQTATYFSRSGLQYETTYYWRIVSYDTFGHNSSSPLWMFTTKASGNTVPVVPSDLQGITDGYHGSVYEYTVSTVDYDNDSVFYQFNWDDGSYSSWLGPYQSGQSISNNHSWMIPGNYNITVRAKDVNDALSNWSVPLHINMINRPPMTPYYPNPSNGSTNQATESILLWMGGDPDTGDIVVYDVYLGTSFPLDKLVSHQSSTSFSPALSKGTVYYWQIVSWDNFNDSTIGPLWHFQTIATSSGGSSGGGDSSEDEEDDNLTHMPPVASFTFSPAIGHPFESILFDASESTDDGYIIDWTWDFGDGTIGYGEIVTHAFFACGEYTVNLTVIDNDGNTTDISHVITVQPFVLVELDIFVQQENVVVGDDIVAIVDCKAVSEPVLINISVVYSLYHNGSCVWNESVHSTLFDERTLTKNIATDQFELGNYLLSVSILSDDEILAQGSIDFALISETSEMSSTSWSIILIGVIIVVFIGSFIVYIRRKK